MTSELWIVFDAVRVMPAICLVTGLTSSYHLESHELDGKIPKLLPSYNTDHGQLQGTNIISKIGQILKVRYERRPKP